MPDGLRALKKQITRESISGAAFSLALERGLDNVTLEDIADRAFVSPRTISNYFSSKEAAVLATNFDDPARMIDAFIATPVAVHPLPALREALSAFFRSDEDLTVLRAQEDLVARYPALLPHRMAQYDALEDAIRTAVAERTNMHADIDTRPRLIAGVATLAVKTAVRVWSSTDGDAAALARSFEEAFDDLVAGLANER